MPRLKEIKSYWNSEGANQETYESLCEKLIPTSGKAPTDHGELLREITNLSYDYYNNGFCNLDNSKFDNSIETIEEFKDQILENMKREDFDLVISEIQEMKTLNQSDQIYPYREDSGWGFNGPFNIRFESLFDSIVLCVSKIENN